MAFIRVANFQIDIAKNGGFIQGQTEDGQMFQLNGLQFSTATAIAAVLHGPEPAYDPVTKVFRSFVAVRPVAPGGAPIV